MNANFTFVYNMFSLLIIHFIISCKSGMMFLNFSTYLLSFVDERTIFLVALLCYSNFYKSVSVKSIVPERAIR